MRRLVGILAVLTIILGLSTSGWSQPYFGNQAVVAGVMSGGFPTATFSYTDFPLLADANQAGFRFTAQFSAPITEAQIFCFGTFGSPFYQLVLESDAGGLPSGTVLAVCAQFTPLVGWNDLPFLSPVNLTAGTVYHLVVQWNPATASLSPANGGSLELSSQPDWFYYPLNGAADPQLAVDENSGTGWTSLAQEPIFALNYSGTWSGNPYSTDRSENAGSPLAPGVYFEGFSVPSTLIVDSIGTYAAEALSAGTGNLNWQLMGPGTPFGINLGSGTLALPAQLSPTYAWVDTAMGPVTLSPGNNYVVQFTYIGTGGNTYQIEIDSPGQGLPSPNPFGALSFEGVGAYETHTVPIICGLCGGTASDLADDIPFRMQVVAPPTPTATPTPIPTPPCASTFYISRNVYSPKTDLTGLSIQCSLCQAGRYSLVIYNSAGEKIRTLKSTENQPAGDDVEPWDGKNDKQDYVSSGVYIIQFQEPLGVHQGRVLVIK